jgi:hypothetical protein
VFVQDKNVKDKETGMKPADIEWKKCLFGEGYTLASLPAIRNTRMEMEKESRQNYLSISNKSSSSWGRLKGLRAGG